jgi:hypothetical protein
VKINDIVLVLSGFVFSVISHGKIDTRTGFRHDNVAVLTTPTGLA